MSGACHDSLLESGYGSTHGMENPRFPVENQVHTLMHSLSEH